jgi:hypothetical protein
MATAKPDQPKLIDHFIDLFASSAGLDRHGALKMMVGTVVSFNGAELAIEFPYFGAHATYDGLESEEEMKEALGLAARDFAYTYAHEKRRGGSG